MKAVVVTEFGGPEVLNLIDVPVPTISDVEVLVRVKAVGVNPVDTYLRSGNHAHAPQLPYTPGKDAAGVIESVGKRVTDFAPGDRVYTADSMTGTYAEFAVCTIEQLGHLPERVSFEQGAGIWTPYATAYRALFQKAAIKDAETLLVHGASGGVGIASMQWARSKGVTVIGTAGSKKGFDLVLNEGAQFAFDHNDPSHFEAIKTATAGVGVDVIVEMLANENLEKDFNALAMFGRIVVVGSRGRLDFTPRLAMTKDVTIYGMSLFNTPTTDRDSIKQAIFNGISEGALKPVVGDVLKLSEAAEAHTRIMDRSALGKIVLVL
ncbi:MAG: NADPH:quinone reductase [Pyrinomonadaceae bacterium]